jgi:phosphoglycerate kinase
MSRKTIADLPPDSLRGRKAVVRVDFNVPLDADGRVTDDTRIRRSVPTLEYLRDRGARLVLLSHLGRPKGQVRPELSLRPVGARLSEILGAEVAFCPSTIGPDAVEATSALGDGGIVVLENTRFHAGETQNDPQLARDLADLGQFYVNDAFGTAHRAHASTEGAAREIRRRGGDAVAGFLMERELRFLGEALGDPRRPFVAVLGGSKISGKIDVMDALLPKVDRLLVGGAMANTFFRALGLATGASLVEEDRIDMAREILERAGDRLLLPVDCVVGESIAEEAITRVVDRDQVAEGDVIGDVGTRTWEMFGAELRAASTIVWNGPMGVFEAAPYAEGTLAVARSIAEATDGGALSVVGGGDSAAAAEKAGVVPRLSHVSTGGGASLEFLAGAQLPGVEALSEK